MSWGETTARWKRIPCGGLSTCRLLKTWYFDNFWYYIYLYLIQFVAWKIQWLKSQGLLPDLRWCFDAPRTWTFPWASVCIRTCVFFSNVAARASFRPRVSTRIQEMNGDDIYTYIYICSSQFLNWNGTRFGTWFGTIFRGHVLRMLHNLHTLGLHSHPRSWWCWNASGPRQLIESGGHFFFQGRKRIKVL